MPTDEATHMTNMTHQMSPFLFTRTTDFFVLFKGAFLESTGAFIGALILCFIFAILVTVLSQLAKVYETRSLVKSHASIVSKLLSAGMHGFRLTLHYFAMLIVMTMNIWLILAVVVGHGVGWLLYTLLLHKPLGGILDIDAAVAAGLKNKEVGCDC